MSNERKEPIISGIRPDQDEIARHQQRQKAKSAVNVGASASAAAASSSASPRPIIVRSKLAPFALLLALTGLALAGFSYWQLIQAQQTLIVAESRIAELEGKLEMSDDESTASIATMQAKLKWADTEIRKLWGVSYDTNRKAIAKNKDDLASVKKLATGVDGKISNALKGTSAEIKLINDLIEAQQGAMVDLDRKSADQINQVRQLTDQLAKLKEVESDLKTRVAGNEEAIKAIDAFRRSVNQQLLQLRSGTP